MAKLLKDDPLMDGLKVRQDFLNSLSPDKRKEMINFQKKIDEYLDSVPEKERMEEAFRMMMNTKDELVAKFEGLDKTIGGK